MIQTSKGKEGLKMGKIVVVAVVAAAAIAAGFAAKNRKKY